MVLKKKSIPTLENNLKEKDANFFMQHIEVLKYLFIAPK